MPQLTIQGSWYGSECAVYTGIYADLGIVDDGRYVIEETGAGACGGFNFIVKNLDNQEVIYTSTSSASEASLYLDGVPANPKYDCLNGECILSSIYGTDGIYESKEACELVNQNNNRITDEELAEIQGLINSIEAKKCE